MPDEPKWTAELPKESGWYWIKLDARREVVYVDCDDNTVQWVACSRIGKIKDERGAKWSGPLTPPGEGGEG